ncbi:MAG: hypothetical protein KAV00_07695 [Phycisphaerae bacterium]|nr:hypothetical protein [Phycisphaerae bacterium]
MPDTIKAEGGNILVRPTGGVLATDCKTGCRITLYLEDQQCSSTPRDVTVRLTGKLCYRIVDATPCFGVDEAINIYAAGNTTVLVEYIGRAGACYQRLQPRVNGSIVLWDSGAELLLPYESDTISLQADDRLQIYMNITGGCVNGDHDDHGGRAVWSIDGCPECGFCSPCIRHDQDDASLAIAGACMSNPFWQSGLIQIHPDALFYCEAWDGPTWAGDCCWIWANYVDISEWTAPGWVFNWVLIVCYDSATDTYNANIYVGSDIDNGDPCDWMVGDTPAFTAADVDVTCGPNGKLHGTFNMTGQDSGWGGGDATGCTATVTI